MSKIKIAIIDNGIDESLLKGQLTASLTVNEDNICERDGTVLEQQEFKHGTSCALILQKHLPSCSLVSIRILDDGGKGMVKSLKPALEWCYRNDVHLVNLSLGTVYFADRCTVRSIVNEYSNKGIVIVAASANNGYMSYPASFSNTIGVIAGEKFAVNTILRWQKGIDFEIPCDREVVSGQRILQIGKSNSYATPVVTALARKVIGEGKICHIVGLKRKLSRLCCGMEVEYNNCGTPDWITAAWSDGIDMGDIKPYFALYEGEYRQCERFVDTIIFADKEKAGYYKKAGKNLVYLGKESIIIEGFDRFFWSRDSRARQIESTKPRSEDLPLPCVVWVQDGESDLLLSAIELKTRFCKDGYNMYMVSSEIAGVFCDLAYIPECYFSEKKETLHNFLYWQTYYQQSDGILIVMPEYLTDDLQYISESIDMFVHLRYSDNKYNVEIMCDGFIREKFDMEWKNYEILYKKMLNLLTEEEHEQ